MHLTLAEARAIAVFAAGLADTVPERTVTAEDLLGALNRLGAVQLDTVSVVSRPQETVFWSRFGLFDRDLVLQLYDPAHGVTEHMAHAGALIPRETLPLLRQNMDRYRSKHATWFADPHHRCIADHVLDRIRAEGPLSTREFAATKDPDHQADGWTSDKLETRALDLLWLQGDLLVSRRDANFNRYYDLAERIAPDLHGQPAPDVYAIQQHLIARALRHLGITTATWAKDYWHAFDTWLVSARDTRRILNTMAEEGTAIAATVDGFSEPLWLHSDLIQIVERLRTGEGWPSRTVILAPTDNLVWCPNRQERLWNYEYRNEMFRKAADRKYGYYSMPILHGVELVGRLDPAFDRKEGRLLVRNLHLQPDVDLTDDLVDGIIKTIEDLLAFLGGRSGEWDILQTTPPDLAATIYGRIRS